MSNAEIVKKTMPTSPSLSLIYF